VASSTSAIQTSISYIRCGLFRRLAAAFYDSLLVLAVLILATLLLLPLTGGQAINPGNYVYTLYLFAMGFAFFGGFWTHGGQTLGMRAWRLRVVSLDNQPLTWKQALYRYLAAILSWLLLGLGFWWQWLDREGLALHDRLSGTQLIHLQQSSRQ
jgi:uncharacterized RDD family membrane protein YckC